MKIIAHRGNLNGPDRDTENSPKAIQTALDHGYDVEIDLWYTSELALGHDGAQYPVDIDFLKKDGLWIHCKNKEALAIALLNGLHCFFHDTDKYTLTSKGIIWAYPEHEFSTDAKLVQVMPERQYERTNEKMKTGINYLPSFSFYGVCTDYAEHLKHFKNV